MGKAYSRVINICFSCPSSLPSSTAFREEPRENKCLVTGCSAMQSEGQRVLCTKCSLGQVTCFLPHFPFGSLQSQGLSWEPFLGSARRPAPSLATVLEIQLYSKFPLLSLQVSLVTTSILTTNFWLKQLKFYVITVLEATKNSSAIISWHLLNNFVVRNRTSESMFKRGVKVYSLVSVKIILNHPFF